MPFLPEELGGAEEEAGAHLPAHDVAPLVDQDGQVAIALDPLRVHGADDGLGRRSDDERLLEHGLGIGDERAVRRMDEPVVCDDRALLREALHVFGLLLQEGLGDEQREVGIAVARLLEHGVEVALDVLPDRVAPRLDDHAPTDGRVLGEVGGADDLLVPLRVVFVAGGLNGGLRSLFMSWFRHAPPIAHAWRA